VFRVVVAGLGILRLFDVLNQGIVMLSEALCEVFCCRDVYRRLGRGVMIETDVEFRVITVVCIERGTSYSGLKGVAVREFCE